MTDKATDIEMLTDLLRKESIPVDNCKNRKLLETNRGYPGARAAFYDERHRQKPSLPRLKFLENE